MTAAARKPTTTPAMPSRMSLSAVVKGRQSAPIRAVIQGVEGVGKSTFGAGAPSPIFLGPEDGTAQLDVERFPAPETWTEMLDAVRVLETDVHSYKTLVVDTLDWAEPLLWAHICKRDGMANVEAYGFGKGYSAALDEWRVFLGALERVRKAKGMNVILLAHSWIKTFKSPDTEDFDRYEMKLNAKAAGLIKEWSDCVLFANYETTTYKDSKTKRVRGVSTGARLLFTTRTAAYDAKNRYGLPETLPLSWEDFAAAVSTGTPASAEAFVSEIQRKAALLGGDLEKQALAAIERANNDTHKLSQLNSWANCRLGEAES